MARIFNITANGNFNALDLPKAGGFRLQARTAVDVDIRYVGETDYWTIKSGQEENFAGSLGSGGVEIRAANGTVIEVILSSSRGSL